MQAEDPYKVLGLKKTASEVDIKNAYRRLARQYHPDVTNNDPATTEQFKRITLAYELLSDPARKRNYDLFGAPDDKAGPLGPLEDEVLKVVHTVGGWANKVGEKISEKLGVSNSPIPGGSHEMVLDISFLESYTGCKKELPAPWRDEPNIGVKNHTFEVVIPAGIKQGTQLRLKGMGHLGQNGGVDGDLYVKINVAEDTRFIRTDDALRTIMRVDIATAFKGGSLEVPMPEGALQITLPAGTKAGQIFRVKSRGFYNHKTEKRDDFLVQIEYLYPETVQQKEQLIGALINDLQVAMQANLKG